jgi:hypothetical protein
MKIFQSNDLAYFVICSLNFKRILRETPRVMKQCINSLQKIIKSSKNFVTEKHSSLFSTTVSDIDKMIFNYVGVMIWQSLNKQALA